MLRKKVVIDSSDFKTLTKEQVDDIQKQQSEEVAFQSYYLFEDNDKRKVIIIVVGSVCGREWFIKQASLKTFKNKKMMSSFVTKFMVDATTFLINKPGELFHYEYKHEKNTIKSNGLLIDLKNNEHLVFKNYEVLFDPIDMVNFINQLKATENNRASSI
jgi:hypothetical protein